MDDTVIQREALVNEARDKIAADPTKPVRRIYDEVAARQPLQSSDDDVLPEFDSVRTALRRERRKTYPAIPHSVNDVVIDGPWADTWTGKRFLCHQDNCWGIAIYMTKRDAARLSRCREIFVDGTFKICPKPYVQVLTVHGLYYGRVLPFAFCLLRSKEVGVYRQVFHHLKCRIRRATRRAFRPQRVVCDFELSLLTALETELPGAARKGCYFHFCQSLWRRIQTLGLARGYRRHRQVRTFLRKFMSMGYLPLAVVRQNFRLLYNSNTVRRLVRRVPLLRQFISYFRRNYMDGYFRPALWNVFDRNVNTRTNNHIEGKVFQL